MPNKSSSRSERIRHLEHSATLPEGAEEMHELISFLYCLGFDLTLHYDPEVLSDLYLARICSVVDPVVWFAITLLKR